MTARQLALTVLFDVFANGAYVNISLKTNLLSHPLNLVDRSFVTELVLGTIENKIHIDYIICAFSKIAIKKMSPWILNVLRLGIYQILFLDKIPDSAAVNECVKLAKKYGHAASAGFVNGVLRAASRGKADIKYPDYDKDFNRFLEVYYSYPAWMIAYFVQKFGKSGAEDFLKASNQSAPLTIRVNSQKTDSDYLIKILAEAGVSSTKGSIPSSLTLSNSGNITALDCFLNGLFYVQDAGATLTSLILAPKEGSTVIDVCAAPGGKTTHLAELMKNSGEVIAFDIFGHKLDLIKENAHRLGITIIKPILFDATKVMPEYAGHADFVLADVPCMGLGIIRRKPDIKWTKEFSDIEGIALIQKEILRSAASYVKPGGYLLYSTCSLCDEENMDQINLFLDEHQNFKLSGFKDILPSGFSETVPGVIELYPHIHGTDGFFIAKLKREN